MPDVILPVLNEARALPAVLARLPAGYDPLVVDNASVDGSASVAKALGARVVTEPRRGFGAACFRGLLAADADVVCFMDCDGSLDPSDLDRVAGPVVRSEADLVMGTRSTSTDHFRLHTRVANAVLAMHLRRRIGVPLSDIGPMRAARRDALLTLGLRDRRFGWPLEMVLRAAEDGWRIVEVPVACRPRIGRSKVTGTLRGCLQTTHDMVRVLARQGAA